MYLLQTAPDNTLFYGFLGLIIYLVIIRLIIKSAVNGSRSTAYLEAQLKLTAMMAKRNGVDPKDIKLIIERADATIFNNDSEFKKDIEPESFTVGAH
jgi:hypothetical protein